ncbi:hypothetical protein Q765_11300 [Flavobacterium rivuli WB 3.3-2 = DSM 21788]|uniref:Lipoprotein n=1 Tax=Flavobacterium rivuli WB 3.3-2 = DSM 21788 TaxID=1121895 RepID=A0A0A2M1D7_9FLAO|nr:hypothetical protein [Flavobacterium rivuli]KGO86457.1 hypothetical protein Q765_11300 [Flavobacterium rivuli WB 3.3-2 = DSM 21788]
MKNRLYNYLLIFAAFNLIISCHNTSNCAISEKTIQLKYYKLKHPDNGIITPCKFKLKACDDKNIFNYHFDNKNDSVILNKRNDSLLYNNEIARFAEIRNFIYNGKNITVKKYVSADLDNLFVNDQLGIVLQISAGKLSDTYIVFDITNNGELYKQIIRDKQFMKVLYK